MIQYWLIFLGIVLYIILKNCVYYTSFYEGRRNYLSIQKHNVLMSYFYNIYYNIKFFLIERNFIDFNLELPCSHLTSYNEEPKCDYCHSIQFHDLLTLFSRYRKCICDSKYTFVSNILRTTTSPTICIILGILVLNSTSQLDYVIVLILEKMLQMKASLTYFHMLGITYLARRASQYIELFYFCIATTCDGDEYDTNFLLNVVRRYNNLYKLLPTKFEKPEVFFTNLYTSLPKKNKKNIMKSIKSVSESFKYEVKILIPQKTTKKYNLKRFPYIKDLYYTPC